MGIDFMRVDLVGPTLSKYFQKPHSFIHVSCRVTDHRGLSEVKLRERPEARQT